MYRFAGPDQESRDATEEATNLMSECTARLALRHDLFLLVKAVAYKDDCPNEEGGKAVRDILREYTNVGHGKLSSDQIEMLLDSRKQIGQLCQDFNRNLRENTDRTWFTPAELEGVSMQEIQRLTENGKDQIYIDFGKRADRLLS
jgi:metallopeptidase MepB